MQNVIIEKLTISSLTDSKLRQSLQTINPAVSHLSYRGDISALNNGHPRIAIIGTRKMTAAGREATYRLAEAATKYGAVVISGLAFGVDTTAHQATLDSEGVAVAVLPGSLEAVYPAHHQQQAAHIIEGGGLLLSEEPYLLHPKKYHFILRNRIIAALADIILVTEAPAKSGSLHTVAYGTDINTPIAAVPGALNNPQAAGTNLLIRDGAHIITTPDDLLQLLQRAPGGT